MTCANLYETLGIPKNSDVSGIKRAYRKKARETHPDTGGDHNKFVAVAVAYGILSDPDKRARYDCGEDPEPPPTELMAQKLMVEVFHTVLRKAIGHIETVNIIDACKELVGRARRDARDNQEKAQTVKGQLLKARERLGKKPGTGEDLLMNMIDKEITDAGSHIKACDQHEDALLLIHTADKHNHPFQKPSSSILCILRNL